jgi:glycosyltransferase involved in cell wall biosynthesis
LPQGALRLTPPKHPSLAIIVATYEWPEALDVVLRALSEERDPAFEVVVADDGSGLETRTVVERWHETFGDRIKHVWQPDEGFRLARVRNLAALAASGDYLVFIDGDAIPRRGFVSTVRRAALPGWFLASKRLNLSTKLSRRVLAERLPVWRWSALEWLLRAPRELVTSPDDANRPGVLLPIRDRRRPWRKSQPEFTPPYVAGYFIGVARHDFERVNGFDGRFLGWGGEDQDLANRLRRIGLMCGWPGPRATMLHLSHPRRKDTTSYLSLVQETVAAERVDAVEGLRELAAELAADQVSAKRIGASSSSNEPENR